MFDDKTDVFKDNARRLFFWGLLGGETITHSKYKNSYVEVSQNVLKVLIIEYVCRNL